MTQRREIIPVVDLFEALTRPAKSATSPKPYRLTPSEIESLRAEARKASAAADAYLARKAKG